MKFKKLIKESISETVEKAEMHPAVADYRKFANIDENAVVTADTLDEWALTEAAIKNNVQKYDLKHMVLGEDATIGQARELDADVVRSGDRNYIEEVLDRALADAKVAQALGETSDFPNIWLEGPAGTGKTEMVEAWAKKAGVNLVYENLQTSGVNTFGGIAARDPDDPRYATVLGNNRIIKALEKPNSVLFLDEYNRAKKEVRGLLLTLIQSHKIWDPNAEGQVARLPNFLFTIIATNPSGGVYRGAQEMDPAERTRFERVPTQLDPIMQLKYLRQFYTDKIQKLQDSALDADRKSTEIQKVKGRLALAEKILMDPRFKYDTEKDEEDNVGTRGYQVLNFRSFKRLLDATDGTKATLLDYWSRFCNFQKKHTIEEILSDYVDVQDEATAAIKDDSTSTVFKREKDVRSKLRGLGFNV